MEHTEPGPARVQRHLPGMPEYSGPAHSHSSFWQQLRSHALKVLLEGGIVSAQATALFQGRATPRHGIYSLEPPHNPPECHPELLNVLTGQAAEAIERTKRANP